MHHPVQSVCVVAWIVRVAGLVASEAGVDGPSGEGSSRSSCRKGGALGALATFGVYCTRVGCY